MSTLATPRLCGSPVTISAWIKSTSYPRDDAAIVSSHNGVGFQLDTTIDRGPRTIGFKLGSPCGLLMARYGKTPLALNTWYYVAGVYNAKAKTMDVYLNGELDKILSVNLAALCHQSTRRTKCGPQERSSFGSTIETEGMGTINLAPHLPTWRICCTISSLRFHGRIRM